MLLAVLLPVSSAAGAEDGQPERIQFAPGATSAIVVGTLAPGAIAAYILRATEGQTMTITLASDAQDNYIAISGADDGAQRALWP